MPTATKPADNDTCLTIGGTG
eukprot:COSAG05_NODE_16264_length_350_cov_0.613546_2_plen_20_part_01